MKDLREQIKCGFYGEAKGDGGVHDPIDSTLDRKFIKHTHTNISMNTLVSLKKLKTKIYIVF